jgi:hypothetical protein
MDKNIDEHFLFRTIHCSKYPYRNTYYGKLIRKGSNDRYPYNQYWDIKILQFIRGYYSIGLKIDAVYRFRFAEFEVIEEESEFIKPSENEFIEYIFTKNGFSCCSYIIT